MSDRLVPRQKCGAKTRTEDKHPCGQWPEKGTNRCRFHGGRSPQVKAKAAAHLEEERVEEGALRLLRKMKIEPVENPLQALHDLAGTVLAWQKVMQKMVNDLAEVRYRGIDTEQIRGEVLLFERSMDRAASVLTAMARLDIDARLVRISERQAELVEQALMAGMYDAHLPPALMEKTIGATVVHLRALAAS